MKSAERQVKPQTHSKPSSNGDPPPARKRGAAAALERLEASEEEAYRRLQVALERGDQFQIQACQEFWLRCSETLRRLDISIELARRDAEEQVPKKLACDVALYISDWLRIAFVQFRSSESRSLMEIRDVGQWKYYAMERFKGILDLTVITASRRGVRFRIGPPKRSENRGTWKTTKWISQNLPISTSSLRAMPIPK